MYVFSTDTTKNLFFFRTEMTAYTVRDLLFVLIPFKTKVTGKRGKNDVTYLYMILLESFMGQGSLN